MKKILLPAILSLLLFACADNSFQGDLFDKAAPIKAPEAPTCEAEALVTCSNGILQFPDQETFAQVVACLAARDDEWNESFLAEWPNLTDDELATKEAELTFNDNEMLERFEANFTYTSLRKTIWDAETEWLKQPVLDPATNPNDHSVLDTYVQTLLNEYGEIQIGSHVQVYKPDGDIYVVTDASDLAAIKAIRTCTSSIINDYPNIIYLDESNSERMLCSKKGTSQSFDFPTGTQLYTTAYLKFRRFIGQVNTSPIFSVDKHGKVTGKIIAYKKINGNWKRHKTNLTVGIPQSVVLDDCSTSILGIAPVKTKKRKAYAQSITYSGLDMKYEFAGFQIEANLSGNSSSFNLQL